MSDGCWKSRCNAGKGRSNAGKRRQMQAGRGAQTNFPMRSFMIDHSEIYVTEEGVSMNVTSQVGISGHDFRCVFQGVTSGGVAECREVCGGSYSLLVRQSNPTHAYTTWTHRLCETV